MRLPRPGGRRLLARRLLRRAHALGNTDGSLSLADDLFDEAEAGRQAGEGKVEAAATAAGASSSSASSSSSSSAAAAAAAAASSDGARARGARRRAGPPLRRGEVNVIVDVDLTFNVTVQGGKKRGAGALQSAGSSTRDCLIIEYPVHD